MAGIQTISAAARHHRTELLEAVFRHSPIGKALVSPDGQFIAVNPALSRILGFTVEQLQSLTFQEITHPDDLDADLLLLDELIRGLRDHYSMVKRYIHRDTHHVWAQLDVAMVSEHSGVPAFFIAQVQDVTGRLQDQRELTERLQLAQEATQDVIWDWAVGRTVQVVGPAAQLTGLTAPDGRIDWRHWWRQVHPADRPQLTSHVREHLSGVRPHLDVQYRHRQGTAWRWRSLRGRVTRWTQGVPARLTGTLSDIDDRVRAERHLGVLIDHLPARISYWDADFNIRFFNRAFLRAEGRAHAHVGQHASTLVDASTYARLEPMMQRALRGEDLQFEARLPDANGGLADLQLHLVPDRQDGETVGFLALGVDVTALRGAERALFAQKELAQFTLMSIGDSVITTDPQGRVTFLNPVAQRMTGWTQDEAMGQPIETVMPLTEEGSGEPMTNPLRLALDEHRTYGMAAGAVLHGRTGDLFSVEDSAAPIITPAGEQLGGVIVFHDVTEKRALTERMTYLAQHDPLTGLPNRALLRDRIAQLAEFSQRQGNSFALAFLDLDGFKAVNDTLGHSEGDQLLRQVACRLQAALRTSDTVSRVGGDEFVLLLPELQHLDHARVLIDKILGVLDAPFSLDAGEVRITGSLGLALYPQDGETVEDLMRHADVAMYRAKSEGRNRACCFNEDIGAEQMQRHRLVQAVRQAVALQQFTLAYQPKINAATGALIGVEALLRWTHEGRPVSPGVVVPIAEETGLMTALGSWVLRAACEQAQAWADAGEPVRVSVNVSASQFREAGFADTVRRTLRDTRLPPTLLELEVTEGVLMRDVTHVQQVLRDLQALGVQISIDDFGTGYSSLSYLHQLPLNTLKIDRSFVQDSHSDPQRSAVLRSIITLAQSLQLSVLAEGVETPQERQHLLDLGCEQMQGYLFSRPVAAPDLTGRLSGGW